MICNANTSARICVVKVENYDNRKLSFFVVLGGRGLQRRERQGCIFKVLKGSVGGWRGQLWGIRHVMSSMHLLLSYPPQYVFLPCFYHTNLFLVHGPPTYLIDTHVK